MGVIIKADFSSARKAFQQFRDQRFKVLQAVFNHWKQSPGRTLDTWVRDETLGMARGLTEAFRQDEEIFTRCLENEATCDVLESLRFPMNPFRPVVEELFRLGVPRGEWPSILDEFFVSDTFAAVPAVRIAALLYAVIADQTSNRGRTVPPDRGYVQDVEAISAFLPYCDAMFLDRKCHAYIRELGGRFEYSTRLFSMRNMDDFINRLGEIAHLAPREHYQRIEEVYGKDLAHRLKDVFNFPRAP